MRDYYDWIYLSPHLDDAILSCGGQIHRRVREGQRVLVITLMAPERPLPPPTPFAARFLEMCGLGQDAGKVRRQEDVAACARVGADIYHESIQEGNVRVDSNGTAMYPNPETLFGKVREDDFPVREELSRIFSDLPRHGSIVAPLGVGGHVDHQLVRSAADDVFGQRLIYYEDFPYANKWGSVRSMTQPADQWQSEVVRLDPSDRKARLDAFYCYKSQWPMLFGRESSMKVKNYLFLARRGGERLWQIRVSP